MEKEKGIFPDNDGLEIKSEINYSILNYDTFDCRSVALGDKPTGECHIKIKIKDEESLIGKLRSIDTAEVGFVDPTGILTLEYPFFLKVTGIIAKENLFDTLAEIDKQLSK